MEQGSVRGSMLALTATAIGGGVLSLPYVCQLCGLVLGIVMLILGYLATLWSFSLIISSDDKTGGHAGMKEFLESTVGKTSSRLYDLIAIFYLFGALTGYQIIIANLIQGIMENLEVPGAQNYRLFHILLVSAFIVFPLCLFRSVDAFRYISLISILGIFYTALLLIIELPFFYMNPELQGKLELFKLNWGFFNAFGITFFAFTCQPGFFAAIEKLKKKDYEHKSKIVFRSVTINLSFYIIIILAGYLSTFDKTTDLIIHRKSPFKLDILMIVAQGMIVAGLCIGTPINFVPLRKAVWGQIFKDSEYTVGRYLF